MKQQELKKFLYQLDSYIPKNEFEEKSKQTCLKKIECLSCIETLNEIDSNRFFEMKHILEKQPTFLSYAISLSTLISLIHYNVAIISYSKEEVFLAIQIFKEIDPINYSIYDNKTIALLSNRMYLNHMLETYSIEQALKIIPEYLDGCEMSYQMGVTK